MISTVGDSRDLVVLDAAGEETRRIASAYALRSAADGSAVAFVTAEFELDGTQKPGTTVYLRDNSSGALRSLRIAGAYDPAVHAVVGSTVYLSYKSSPTDSDGGLLRKWVAGSTRTTRVAAVPWPTAVSGDGELAATLLSVTEAGSCSALVDLAAGKQRWQTCRNQVHEFAPDLSTVLAQPAYLDGYAYGDLTILDSRDGTMVRQWNAESIMAERFEDSDHVLMVVEQGRQSAIVRCTITTGACELARPLVTGTQNDGNARYGLAN
jgi:hypothetical protein